MSESPLIYFVRERESIRKLKESGAPPPWTDDPILSQYRFTNVRRRHDRVTKWLLENVLTQAHLERVGFRSFVLFTALCRFVNWPPTIAFLMKEGLYRKGIPLTVVGNGIDHLMREGNKVWTGSYMVRAAPEHQMGKGLYVAEKVVGGLKPVMKDLKQLLVDDFSHRRSRKAVWELLCKVPGIGSFMSGQIVDDWAMTPLLGAAMDHSTFAPQGPGSVKGLNRLMGLPLKTRWSMENWLIKLQELRAEIVHALGVEFSDMTLADCQNCLCEVSKLLKTRAGEGRPRSKYRTETVY